MTTAASSARAARPPLARLALTVAVLLAAFVLRMGTLERRPLHFDEGNSVYFAHLSLPDLLQASIDTHEADPPGYRLSLGAWIGLAGPAPLSIRLYSVLYGILALAALFALLRELRLPYAPSLLAALLLAGSAFAIDYSQQAKGYAMGAAMAMLSWWAWARMMRGRGAKPAPATCGVYVLSTLLMLSTHYYTAPVLAMEWLWFALSPEGVWRARQWRLRSIAIGVLAQFLACLPIAIWTVLAMRGILTGATGLSRPEQSLGPLGLFMVILNEMSAGQFADTALATIAALAFGLGAVLGGLRLWRAGRRDVFWFGVSMLVPIAGAALLQQRITFFSPRFLLYAMPCLCALIAGLWAGASAERAIRWASFKLALLGAVASAERAATVVGVACLVVTVAANVVFTRAPVDVANDFRPLVAAMRPNIQAGDAALGSFIWMQGMLLSYAPESAGRVSWYADFYTPDNLQALMAPIAGGHRRVWSFNFQRDPDAQETLSVQWLKSHAAYAGRFSAGTLSALLFDTTSAGQMPQAGAEQRASFEQGITLSYRPLQASAHAGDTVVMALAWQTERATTGHYTIFMHLRARDGGLAAQNDGDAVNGLAPSFTWKPGTPVKEARALLIGGDLPPGDYTLEAGLYRPEDGERLLTDGGDDAVRVGAITIAAK